MIKQLTFTNCKLLNLLARTFSNSMTLHLELKSTQSSIRKCRHPGAVIFHKAYSSNSFIKVFYDVMLGKFASKIILYDVTIMYTQSIHSDAVHTVNILTHMHARKQASTQTHTHTHTHTHTQTYSLKYTIKNISTSHLE